MQGETDNHGEDRRGGDKTGDLDVQIAKEDDGEHKVDDERHHLTDQSRRDHAHAPDEHPVEDDHQTAARDQEADRQHQRHVGPADQQRVCSKLPGEQMREGRRGG